MLSTRFWALGRAACSITLAYGSCTSPDNRSPHVAAQPPLVFEPTPRPVLLYGFMQVGTGGRPQGAAFAHLARAPLPLPPATRPPGPPPQSEDPCSHLELFG